MEKTDGVARRQPKPPEGPGEVRPDREGIGRVGVAKADFGINLGADGKFAREADAQAGAGTKANRRLFVADVGNAFEIDRQMSATEVGAYDRTALEARAVVIDEHSLCGHAQKPRDGPALLRIGIRKAPAQLGTVASD